MDTLSQLSGQTEIINSSDQDPDRIEPSQIGVPHNYCNVIILAIEIQPVATGSIDEFACLDELQFFIVSQEGQQGDDWSIPGDAE